MQPKIDLIVCADINVHYLNDSVRVSWLSALPNSCNLFRKGYFSSTIGKESVSAVANIFIGSYKFDNYRIFPLDNGLVDHDAQLIIINIPLIQSLDCQTYFRRKINTYTIADFQIKLSYETWDSVFEGDEVNKIFNSFLNT